MLPDLQYLGTEQRREPDVGVLAGILEVLYLLVVKGDGKAKETVRAAGTYYVVRELHLAVEDEIVRDGCDRLVQVLMQEEGGGNEETQEGTPPKNPKATKPDSDDDDDRIVEIF